MQLKVLKVVHEVCSLEFFESGYFTKCIQLKPVNLPKTSPKKFQPHSKWTTQPKRNAKKNALGVRALILKIAFFLAYYLHLRRVSITLAMFCSVSRTNTAKHR